MWEASIGKLARDFKRNRPAFWTKHIKNERKEKLPSQSSSEIANDIARYLIFRRIIQQSFSELTITGKSIILLYKKK